MTVTALKTDLHLDEGTVYHAELIYDLQGGNDGAVKIALPFGHLTGQLTCVRMIGTDVVANPSGRVSHDPWDFSI